MTSSWFFSGLLHYHAVAVIPLSVKEPWTIWVNRSKPRHNKTQQSEISTYIIMCGMKLRIHSQTLVWEWISNFIPRSTCWGWKLIHVIPVRSHNVKSPQPIWRALFARFSIFKFVTVLWLMCSHLFRREDAVSRTRHPGDMPHNLFYNLYLHPSPKVMADFFPTQKLTWFSYPICTIFGRCIKCMQVFIFRAKYMEFFH